MMSVRLSGVTLMHADHIRATSNVITRLINPINPALRVQNFSDLVQGEHPQTWRRTEVR